MKLDKSFSLRKERKGAYIILRAIGRLDFAAYRQISDVLEDEKADRQTGVILNLEGVTSVTSSGISIIAKVSMEHRLKVVGPRREVRELLDLSGVSAIIEICDSDEIALRQLATP